METWITEGRIIDPWNRIDGRLNLVLENGKVKTLTTEAPPAGSRVIHAAGKVVCPGFLDVHMHEAPVGDLADMEHSIFGCMLRMGVTMGLGGNCGENVLPPDEYFEKVREGLPISLALLAGHGAAREAAGFSDRYQQLTPEQVHHLFLGCSH